MIKILFFGDICGEPGRKAVKQILPDLLTAEKPDLVVANVENLAHGKGVTIKTLEELMRAGVNAFTGGNHIFSKKDFVDEVFAKYADIIARPVNIPISSPGKEAIVVSTPKGDVLIGNFLGQVFMEKQFHDPIDSAFAKFESWLSSYKSNNIKASLIDFHAEATSEKIAFGYFIDGKVSVLLGTHTHIPTADAKILSGGTAYQTDVGMCGAAGSVLGVVKEQALKRFLTNTWVPFDIPEDASNAEISYVIINVDESNGLAASISSQHQIIKLK